MDSATIKQKRRRLIMVMAAVGFLIAVVIWAFSELTASSPAFNLHLWGVFIFACPPSLLTIPLIDVEPGSIDFAVTWLVVGLLNSGLYAVIGIMIGRFRWKPESGLLDEKGMGGPASR